MKVKSLFVIWRCILMAHWLLEHETVHNMPLYLPYLIQSDMKLLTDAKKRMLKDKLYNGINKGIYAVDDEFDVLSNQLWLKQVLDELLNDIQNARKLRDGKENNLDRKSDEKLLEQMVVDMIEKYDDYGDVKVTNIQYNYKIEDELLVRMDKLIAMVEDAINESVLK